MKEIRSIIGEDGELFVQSTAAIDAAIDQFTRDFQGLTGEGKTMADC